MNFYHGLRYIRELDKNNHIEIKRILSHKLFESKNSSFDGESNEDKSKFYVETELAEPKITIPKDTVLEIDRIYIRKGLEEYSSISFLVDSSPEIAYKPKAELKRLGLGHIAKKHKIRFFAKLKDVNLIEFR